VSARPEVKALVDFLHDARRGKLKRGSLFLASDTIAADVPAMFLPDFTDPRVAIEAGFTRETLSSGTIEQCVEWARNYHDPPDAHDMLETFTYYVANDAFPPLPGER
jgi:hypothetical protein